MSQKERVGVVLESFVMEWKEAYLNQVHSPGTPRPASTKTK
jgi:hypothetical protein